MSGTNKARLVLVGAALILALMVLARLDNWTFKNETFNNLSFGLDVPADHPSLAALREASEENCRVNETEDLARCLDYQRVITQNLYFAHPLSALFGLLARDAYANDRSDWLPKLQSIVVASQLTGAALAILLTVLLLAQLPPPHRVLSSIVLICFALFGFYRDDGRTLLPDPVLDGLDAWEAVALPLIAIVLGAAARWALSGRHRAPWLFPALDGAPVKWLFRAALLLVLVNVAAPSLISPIIQIASFAGFAWILALLTRWIGLPPVVAAAVGLFLLILFTGEPSSFLRKLEVSKALAALVFGAYCAYLVVRPRGRLIWILPALCLLHVSATLLMALALFFAEVPLCLRRRRFSPAIAAAALTVATAFLLTSAYETDLFGYQALAIEQIIAILVRPATLWPGLVVCLGIAGLSFWILLRRSDEWDRVAWAGFLVLQAVGSAWISFAIVAAAPGDWHSAQYFTMVQIPSYLNPGLTLGAGLGLVALLGARLTDGALGPGAVGEGAQSSRAGWRLWRPVLVLVLLIGASKMELRWRPLLIDAAKNTYAYLIDGSLDARWARHLVEAAGDDDVYVLSADNPRNHPVIYFSRLKLKTRIVLGLHDPDAMLVKVSRTGREE